MVRKLLSTGQAAAQCSVTPDTVLKWIRSGVLPARRTAGGHHRIDARDLELVLDRANMAVAHQAQASEAAPGEERRHFRYCWEHNGNGSLLAGCLDCAVYQMRAQRCYEVARLAPDAGLNRVFCETSCDECDYFRAVHEQRTNVLVVTDDEVLTGRLRGGAASAEFNIEVTDCEYQCSAVVNHFRPDFAVVDCALGQDTSRDICFHLQNDPRIPFVKVVLAVAPEHYPEMCDREVFARIERPFGVDDLARFIVEAQASAADATVESGDATRPASLPGPQASASSELAAMGNRRA